MRFILSGVLMSVALLLSSCQSVGYYAQSVAGQLQVMHRARHIDEWLDAANTSAELKQKLRLIQSIRAFASTQLSLPENNSYTHYADLQRPYVVWNIVAAEEFSLQPYSWRYPFIGFQTYRGFFSRQRAMEQATKLKEKNYDVAVGGVKAYSTLGWFNDPVLNTFVNYSLTDLAALIFHELSHQVVYVKGDTVFNESFATLVENKGVEAWLAHQGKSVELDKYLQAQEFDNRVLNMIAQHKAKLNKVYQGKQTQAVKRARKKGLFQALKSNYARLRAEYDGGSAWDNWFAQELNNANLVSIDTYYEKVGEFERLFAQSGGDFALFFARVRELAKENKQSRDQFLASLASS